MRRPALLAGSVLSLLLNAGCAAVFDGGRSTVTFTADLPDTQVVAGDVRGSTPVSLKVDKGINDVTFQHAGYPDQKVALHSSFMVGYLLMDVLFTPGFGLSGILIDGFSSSWWSHPPIVHCDFLHPQQNSVPKKVEQDANGVDR